MKRATLALTLTLVLLFSVVVGTDIKVVKANFVPTSPATDPPIISIISPSNKTYEIEVLLHLNVTLHYPEYKEINYVGYTLDSQEHVVSSNYGKKDMNWSTILEGLSEGTHILQVSASCKSYYASQTSGGYLYYRTFWAYSDVINFTVIFPPQISILSLGNKTYTTSSIQLNFTVNEPVSKIEYSLDEQENVTIGGNATLTDLVDGMHNVTIYALDMDGHVGVSETINFSIALFPTVLISVAAASVAVIAIGLLVYFKKRDHAERQTS
jgi:hypothetical protein